MSSAPSATDARHILVVEDEDAISDVVATALRYQGHQVSQSATGPDGLAKARTGAHDLVVLDVMLPGMDGYEVCRRLRDDGLQTPVLFLTARDEPDDRVTGFVTGGDDYLTKPFSVDELTLRVAAILRRTSAPSPTDVMAVGDLVLDPGSHDVRRGGEHLDLSPTEFRLLHYLMANANTVVSKAQILVNVWDQAYDGSENVVELYIGYLRRKVDDGRPALIHTKRGAGYVLRSTAAG